MASDALSVEHRPELVDGTLILGFSGWMDGSEISTGTVEYLRQRLRASQVAHIEPSPFFIYNMPGSMEVAALFRPHVRIEDGLVVEMDAPKAAFYCSAEHNLLLFEGREPNLRWNDFADCVLRVVFEFNVRRIFFVGSVSGTVPHTRDPRLYTSVSHERMLPALRRQGLALSQYEGPGSFVTFLTLLARKHDIELATLVAEIPAYVQGRNVKCIDAIVKRLSTLAGLKGDFSDLAEAAVKFEEHINAMVAERSELADLVRRMEEDYDQQLHAGAEDDLKAWLERQGLNLDW